jgi:hypothetical protein
VETVFSFQTVTFTALQNLTLGESQQNAAEARSACNYRLRSIDDRKIMQLAG